MRRRHDKPTWFPHHTRDTEVVEDPMGHERWITCSMKTTEITQENRGEIGVKKCEKCQLGLQQDSRKP